MNRNLATFVITLAALAAPPWLHASEDQNKRALIDKYCVTCHNQRAKTAGLMLDKLPLDRVPQDAETWEKVIRKLHGRMMPPPGAPRPEDASLDGLAAWLENTIDQAAAASPRPGYVMLHRLNRAEYGNAVRDLLDLTDTNIAALLPSDDDSDGFDNVASVLKESPAFIEGYIGAARQAALLAVGDPTAPIAADVYRSAVGSPQHVHVEGMPLGTRGGLLVRHYFPLDGEYKFDVTLRQSQIYVKGLEFPHTLIITIDGQRVFERSVGGPEDLKAQDQELATATQAIQGRFKNLRFPVKAGPHALAVTFLARSFTESDEVLQPYTRDVGPSGGMNGMPSVEKLEIMGPYKATGPGDTPARRRIFVCHPANESEELPCARRILTAIETRAFRRPVSGADLETPLSFYQKGRNQGGFEKGIQNALTYVLASPKFLYRAETDPANLAPGANHALNDLELASRLSFFLWSSVPDQELLSLAKDGRLADPAVLEHQVRRLLSDPKADSLVKNFFLQWLRLRDLALFDPDTSEYPNFEEDLRKALESEIELFTGSIVREDRSVLDLLTADYTFVNERLAAHYGIPGIRGGQFRRVTLTDPNRWGLLGKGSVLAVTSYANRTSPVLRGRWVLENILGTPPPLPPPNVPALKENLAGGVQLSVRQLLEQHRANPTCASCHRLIDPPGFALENFDAVGAWRNKDHGVRVDAAGKLADGTEVDGPAGLRAVILRRPEQFVSTMTEKLMTYALGRSIVYTDMPTVRAVVHRAARDDYRFSSLVLAVVRSAPFQLRSVPPSPAATEVAAKQE